MGPWCGITIKHPTYPTELAGCVATCPACSSGSSLMRRKGPKWRENCAIGMRSPSRTLFLTELVPIPIMPPKCFFKSSLTQWMRAVRGLLHPRQGEAYRMQQLGNAATGVASASKGQTSVATEPWCIPILRFTTYRNIAVQNTTTFHHAHLGLCAQIQKVCNLAVDVLSPGLGSVFMYVQVQI